LDGLERHRVVGLGKVSGFHGQKLESRFFFGFLGLVGGDLRLRQAEKVKKREREEKKGKRGR
jgi:hypothetical protein